MSVSFSTIVQRARPAATHAVSSQMREVLNKIPSTTVGALPNGLRVATEENRFGQYATVGLWLDVGSADDPAHQSGLARVFERSLLKGTENQSAEQISRAVDELGGHLTLDVGREQSCAYLTVQRRDVSKAVSFLSDVVRNGRFDDEAVAQAKAEALRQRGLFEDRVDDVVFDNLHRAAFDSTGTGLGAFTYGTEDGINAVDASALQQFRKGGVVGRRAVLVGAGAVSQNELEAAAAQYLGDLPKGEDRTPLEPRYVGGDIKLWNLRFKTTHIAWGFETCGANCADSLPLQLSTQVMGNFHRSQHELGQHAVHRVLKTFSSLDHSTPTNTHFPEKCIEIANTFLHQYRDTGLCGMYLVGRPEQTAPGEALSMHEVLYYTLMEWCRMSQKVLHEKELEQAKVNVKAQMLFNCDGATNTAKEIGRQVLYHGRRVPALEMFNRVDDVTVNNTQEVLQHYFFACKPVLSLMGYTYPLPNYDWTSLWTYKYWY